MGICERVILDGHYAPLCQVFRFYRSLIQRHHKCIVKKLPKKAFMSCCVILMLVTKICLSL
jgi:uncharacterized membrane protein